LNTSLSRPKTPENTSQPVPREKIVGRKDPYEDFESPKRKTPSVHSSVHPLKKPTSKGKEKEVVEKYSLKPDFWAIRQDKV